MAQEDVIEKHFIMRTFSAPQLKPVLLFLALFAGIPLLGTIVISLAVNAFDLTAIIIAIILTVVIISIYIFVPLEVPRPTKQVRSKREKAVPKILEPVTGALEDLTAEESYPSQKLRSDLPEFEARERREPFVDVVKKTAKHPAAAQTRKKSKSKSGKKSAKKKKS